MKRIPFLIIILTGVFLWNACTPKIKETTTAPMPQKEVVKEVDPNGCIQFNDLSIDKADVITDNYNLYRDRVKEKQYKEAYPLWKSVYEFAPATNGKVDNVFKDGIKIYTAFYKETSDTLLQKRYVDTVMAIYDKAFLCFPNKKGYYLSKKGNDLFYNYKGLATDEEIYNMLKEASEINGNESRVSTIIPLAKLNYKLYRSEKNDVEEARKTMEQTNNIIAHNLENCKDKKCDPWRQVEQYTSELSNRYENKKGFYDCNYFLDKYYTQFEEQPTNCDVIEDLYRKLKRSGCAKEEPKMVALIDAYQKECYVAPTNPLADCRKLLEAEQFQQAINCYEDYIKTTSDPEQKARFTLRIAKIYYAHLNDFRKSREYARKTLQIKPNWGDPLILIGKLYASSGPLCGPGTGWDSQIVTWPAIDKWNEAKRKDPNVASEASKLIRQYERYMPSKGDIFQRNLNEGSSFKVKCWIQETTKIRAPK